MQVVSKHKVFITKTSTWREHHTSYGKPKKAYASMDNAEEAAKRLATDDALSAYCCGSCFQYHIGRTRRIRLISLAEFNAMEYELGTRVAANLKDEALHPYGAIKKRYLTCVKYALRKGERRAA